MMSVIVIDVGWLEHLAAVAGAKVEVDQDGGVAVSPASDQHVIAATRLAIQLAGQMPQDLEVLVEGPRWSPLGALTPSYVPDLAVIARSALDRVDGDYQLDPPPLLIVEILSPATRRRDLGEKLDNYYFGGARIYWTIEVPGLERRQSAPGHHPPARARRLGVHRSCPIRGGHMAPGHDVRNAPGHRL